MNYNELDKLELEKKAECGDGKAMGVLAFRFEQEENFAKAFELYEKASVAEDSYGMTVMGELLCYDPDGFNDDFFGLDDRLLEFVKFDAGRGIGLLEKAAERKSVYALETLAYFYCFGHAGCEVNYEKALGYAQLALDLGYADAEEVYGAILNCIGCCYADGAEGYEKDEKKGVEYFMKAVELSIPDASAAYNLGMAYENGEGVEKALGKAKKYIKFAADLGNEEAIRYLKEKR